MAVEVVWFKKDLRVSNHRPLIEAAKRGRCLCLYVYEPEIIQSEEFDSSHLKFINQSLKDLDSSLRKRGNMLVLQCGDVPTILDQIHLEYGISGLWSHQETGNRVSYQRDLRVKSWATTNGIPWHEYWQNGVQRPLKSRDGWAKTWQQRMLEPAVNPPDQIPSIGRTTNGKILNADYFNLPSSQKTEVQKGGESNANATLQSFLDGRGVNYTKDMSSPVTATDGCSRLSTYLAWGCISMKEIHQAVQEKRAELKDLESQRMSIDKRWMSSLRSFEGRLRWHCHFMQKLEDEPDIEFENMCRAYDGLREDCFSQSYYEAWCNGQTGYPLVDACMRALHQTGWINFRMRAMLASFASYHLWLHWRKPAAFLAKHFLDFEPGIHFSQFQMQAGTSGINTVRIYSPIKQVRDQDPKGVFIRKFVPELREVPEVYLSEPHKMPSHIQKKAGCVIGRDYPKPVVHHAVAYQQARERIYQVKKRRETREEAKKVYLRHGSRRRPGTRETRD